MAATRLPSLYDNSGTDGIRCRYGSGCTLDIARHRVESREGQGGQDGEANQGRLPQPPTSDPGLTGLPWSRISKWKSPAVEPAVVLATVSPTLTLSPSRSAGGTFTP